LADDGGLSKLQRRLAAIPKNVVAAVQPELRKQAHAMADTMEHLAPEGEGDLKASIAVTGALRQVPAYSLPEPMTVPENAVAITVGDSDVRYPHIIEYGSTKMQAQPFFWPAFRLHRKQATKRIKAAIRRAIKKQAQP
jgi:HK97 gp10 family phage protein